MQGTNISGSTQINEQAVLGRNNETMQGTNPKKLPPIMADVNQNVIGTNIDIEAHSSKEPMNNKTLISPNMTALDSSPTAEDSVQTSAKSSHIRKINEEHKHRPKPKGKHKRPKLPSPAETETLLIPKPPRKSEFVTMTHGLRKPRKSRHFKCNICSVVTDSQALANKHYRKNHPLSNVLIVSNFSTIHAPYRGTSILIWNLNFHADPVTGAFPSRAILLIIA